jgi:hypothetical protein
MLPIIIALALALVMVSIIWYTRPQATTPVQGSSGGVTAASHPQSAASGVTTASAPVVKATVPVNTTTPITAIAILKGTQQYESMPANKSRTFQIGELKVYRADGSLLTASDFSSAVYAPDVAGGVAVTYPASNAIDGDINTFTHTNGEDVKVHSMSLMLKQPTQISKIEVINRVDCCAERLDGSVMILASGTKPVASYKLTGAATQTFSHSRDMSESELVMM